MPEAYDYDEYAQLTHPTNGIIEILRHGDHVTWTGYPSTDNRRGNGIGGAQTGTIAEIVTDLAGEGYTLTEHDGTPDEARAAWDAQRNAVVYAWAEAVTRHEDTVLVPLTTPDGGLVEVALEPAEALLLADMLRETAGQPAPSRWGGGGTQWAIGVAHADGQHFVSGQRYTETEARHCAATWPASSPRRAVALSRTVGDWVEADPTTSETEAGQ